MFNLTPYRKHNEISYYDPFQMMEEMERRFWGGNTLASFKTDIRDKGDSYLLEAELPGFQKEDIDIQLSDNNPVSYTHLRAHETGRNLVCRLLLEKKNK